MYHANNEKQKWQMTEGIELPNQEKTKKKKQCKISPEKTWTWFRKGNLKREIEFLLIAAQNNAVTTNYIKVKIDKTQQNSNYRLFGDREKTINHVIKECRKLSQKENIWLDTTGGNGNPPGVVQEIETWPHE